MKINKIKSDTNEEVTAEFDKDSELFVRYKGTMANHPQISQTWELKTEGCMLLYKDIGQTGIFKGFKNIGCIIGGVYENKEKSFSPVVSEFLIKMLKTAWDKRQELRAEETLTP